MLRCPLVIVRCTGDSMASMTMAALTATSLGASQLQTLQSRRGSTTLELRRRLQYSQTQHQQQWQTPLGRRRREMQQVNASTADRVARLGRAYVNSWTNRTGMHSMELRCLMQYLTTC